MNIKNIIKNKNTFITIRENLLKINNILKNDWKEAIVLSFVVGSLFLPMSILIFLIETQTIDRDFIFLRLIIGVASFTALFHYIFKKIYKKRNNNNFLKIFSKHNPKILLSKKKTNEINKITNTLLTEDMDFIKKYPKESISHSNAEISNKLVIYLENQNNTKEENENIIELINYLDIKKDIEKSKLILRLKNNHSLIKNTMIKKI
jgi:hypothetical protein